MSGTRAPTVVAMIAAMVLTAVLPVAALASVDNDERANAIVISDPLPFVDMRDTSAATSDPADPAPSCVPTSSTVWYSYTASTFGDLQAYTSGSDYDTTLAVYVVQPDESLMEIACNDDFFGLQSWVTFWVESDAELLIMVGAFGEEGFGGNLVLTLDEGSTPPYEPPVFEEIDITLTVTAASVSRSTGHVTLHGTVTCSSEADGYLYGSVRQRLGRSYITGELFGTFSCGPQVGEWSARTYSESGVFSGGQVQAQLWVEAWNEDGYGFTSAEGAARVRQAP